MTKAIEKLEFNIPSKLISNLGGYEYLCYISINSFATTDKRITFNFSENTYFEANLCSPFGALLEGLRAMSFS